MPACQDHTGTTFRSKSAMCRHWGISVSTLDGRMNRGWTLEQSLTARSKDDTACTDHTGRKFPSKKAMCDVWGISDSTLWHRMENMGMSLEDALTMTHETAAGRTRGCTDHEGKWFPSKRAMCRHWGMQPSMYFARIRLGWSLKDALTTPANDLPPNSRSVTDHKGNTFPSVSAMCKHWGMTRSTYNARIKNGWSVEQALTAPKTEIQVAPKACTDHLGQTFPTLNAMCAHWGTTKDTFTTRVRKLGWTMEKALTEPNAIAGREVTDYMGRTFPSMCDLCHFYRFLPQDMQGTDGGTDVFVRSVTRRYKNSAVFGQATIVRQLTFPYFLVSYHGEEYVWDLEQVLAEYHASGFWPLPETKIKDRHLKIIRQLSFPDYLVSYDGIEQTWDYWRIIQYRKDTNYGLSEPQRPSRKERI